MRYYVKITKDREIIGSAPSFGQQGTTKDYVIKRIKELFDKDFVNMNGS